MIPTKLKLWVTKYTPLYESEAGLRRKCYLTENTVLTFDPAIEYGRLVYAETLAGLKGWVERADVEHYIESHQKDCVFISDIQTPEPTDFEQYINWHGKQVNMCGELCVCYALGIPLSTLLSEWETKQPAFFKRIWAGGRATGTTSADLIKMHSLFSTGGVELSTKLKRYTPGALQELSVWDDVIASVKMDSVTGYLRGQGIGHWVKVLRVEPERCSRGRVTVYNPAPNRIEEYSWSEFIASARQPYGAIL